MYDKIDLREIKPDTHTIISYISYILFKNTFKLKMNKQKNIDIAHEERFDYGLISIMVFFFFIILSAIQVNMIFFLLKN